MEYVKKFYEVSFIVVVIGSFLLWLIGIFLNGSESSQFDIFFRRCEDFLADTLNVVGYSGERDVYHNTSYMGLGEKAYPPLTYMMMYFFSRLVNIEKYYDNNYFLDMYGEPKFLTIYLIYAVVQIVMIYELIRTCKNGTNGIKIFTAAAVCLSSPMIYSFERGNTIILTVFCTLLYIFNYDSANKLMKELALVALAIATAFKMTPAVLGILLLYNRQWKEAIRIIIYGVITVVLPFFFFQGGLNNILQMFYNMGQNVENYGNAGGTTLMSALVSFGINGSNEMGHIVQMLTYVLCLILMVLAPCMKHKWETAMMISMMLIIAPPHSEYYCMLYIVPSVIMFLNEEEHGISDIIVLVSILMIMYDFQWEVGEKLFNYHLGTIIIIAVLTVRGITEVVGFVKRYKEAKIQ
ncbi:MAG: glycosyltransferase family 87 protein [Lachnospira sp.]